MAQLVKNLPEMRETWVQSLGWEDPLEKERATHSSILAWRIQGRKESDTTKRVSLTHSWRPHIPHSLSGSEGLGGSKCILYDLAGPYWMG